MNRGIVIISRKGRVNINTWQLFKRTEPVDDYPPRQHWQRYAERPEEIARVFAALGTALRSSFTIMLREAGPLPFTFETLKRWHGPEMPGAVLQLACNPLMELGLLASVRKTWGERMLFIPSDVYERLLVYLLEQQQPQPTSAWVDETLLQPIGGAIDAGSSIEAARGLPLDMFHLLVFAMKEGLPLTSKGTLHKRVITRLAALFRTDESALSGFGVNYPFADTLPLAVAIVIDMALRFGLLRKEPNRYVVNEAEMRIWLQRTIQQWLDAIAQNLIEHYMPAQPRVRHMIHAVLEVGRGTAWHTDSEVIERLRAIGWLEHDESQQAGNRELIRTWLRAAHAVGLCDVGAIGGEWAFRIVERDAEAGEGGFFMQPDFEIVLPSDTPFALRWELEAFAEAQSSDQMDIYRLTRRSFERGIEQGRTKQSVLSFLEEHAWSGVPENVQDALELWSLQYGRVQFAEVVLLRCADKEAADLIREELMAADPYRKWIQAIGEQDFAVDRHRVAELSRSLERIGLSPLQRWEGAEDEAGVMTQLWKDEHTPIALEQEDEAKGMVYSPSSLQYYEIETESLGGDQISSSFHDVPSLWTKALRPFHESTKKDMVTTAIKRQLQLEIERSGKSFLVLPVSLVVTDEGEWKVEAHIVAGPSSSQLQLLSASEWDQMRLILPDVTI
ncbi:helicase-associated domain-containing protein [Paenibacillus apiarius]|uniref:Helicase-associated domain-containing protein n=1 Tax=Paenibacillus apiarius TaxID=46240 RepID=A0ABT4DLJ8_9BACL|nr:helicase-associated domain-containing protein [Paenibacillus apiarius]MCY9513679.1 helicase-associated domain-containing protein [Paenibacillus apiarius]MCY9518230.1 helicase-associated domain-containing protein [Paenibacillus apiarius]MCY9551369.1 helicase-associated domain-containing protein [Paenibacillus apiarius]MCY9558523.1 helicase-associated domain-containing protein [Paenibacillus apiarius]MCY9684163.1 helicase-associated domain-containing protein [Paenibacillus apiarius]